MTHRFRDYDEEISDTDSHRYAYDFDFDVMHGYMMKSFLPWFRPGNVLELGSFKGDFTQRLLKVFSHVTCIEASHDAARHAIAANGERVRVIRSTFEDAVLSEKFDNVIITHVLEHIDDPVGLLTQVRTRWLARSGRLLLVCPNANAASRQIAVRMRLLSHNSAVTDSEVAHGHRITYSLDTLERDAVASGLTVVHRSGIFFKALANFQWDLLLKTDIISKEYLEGCYMLGQLYPDLCASIFLVCE
jgi:SAM-dependent methyltransferase